LKPPRLRITWPDTARLVPSRYPPILLFDRVADSADFEALYALEDMTNDRLRDELGDICLVRPEHRIFGPGTTPIMAAFTHPNPLGSRFSDGSYGMYYTARDIDTAMAEVRHHLAIFYRYTREGPLHTDMRTYYADVDADLHDIRGRQAAMPDIYDAGDYGASQPFGLKLRTAGSAGIAYSSVRHAGGECAAIFRPNALKPAMQGPHFRFDWDGASFVHIVQYHTPSA
jgi:RES domain